MIKDKPILGWGPENFYIGFEKYYDPANPLVKNLWWDRPHNAFLDIAAGSGILSAVLYSLFWIFLLWQLQKFKRQQGDNPHTYLAHGLQAMFIGYLAALFFNFDDFSTYLISFFFIGYSFYLLSNQSEKKIIYPPKANFIKKKFVYVPLLLLLIFFIWFWNIKPLYLNESITYAADLISAKKCDKAMNIMDGVWQKGGILRAYAGLKFVDSIKKCVSMQSEYEAEYAAKGYKALKNSSATQPKFTRTWIFLGGFTNALAAKEENLETQKKMAAEAISYLKKALELSPRRMEIFTEMEKSHLMVKDFEAMKKTAYECIKIDESYGQCYWYLGVAEIFLGDQENGKKHIEESLKKSSVQPIYVQLGVAYISQKNYADAAEAYRRAIVFNNDKNASWHAVLAFLYKQAGEYAKAGREAVKVFELEPENKESLEFLKLLLGLAPNDISIHTSLAYIYNQLGEKEKARQEYLIVKQIYLQAIARSPKDLDIRLNLARVYKALGEYEKARQEAKLVEKIDPNFYGKAEEIIQSLP